MKDSELEAAVLAAYEKRYPSWTDVVVTTMTHNVAGGSLIVVEALDEEKNLNEEACYAVGREVKIFKTTAELTNHIQGRGSFREWVFTGQGVAAIAFLICLLAVIALTVTPGANKEALDILEKILILAAGFFFGNNVAGRRD